VRQFIEMVSGNDEDDSSDNHNNNDQDVVMNGKETNGNSANSNNTEEEIIETPSTTEDNEEDDDDEDEFAEAEMEVDPPPVTANPDRFQKLIFFGQKIKAMLVELETIKGIKNNTNTKMLEDAFALLAYPNPWESPVGWQLSPSEREFVSAALNSTLLEAGGYSPRPPLEVGLSHAKQLVKLMANHDLGACAFANLEDLIKNQK